MVEQTGIGQLTSDVVEGSWRAWILLVEGCSLRAVVANGADDRSYRAVDAVVT